MQSGVLITAQGGPVNLAGVTSFLEGVLGRQPTEDEHQDLWRKYLTVGGVSPVPTAAMEIASGLEGELKKAGLTLPVRAGMLHGNPSLGSAMESLVGAGVSRVAALDLSPMSQISGRIFEPVAAILNGAGLEAFAVPSIYDTPEYVGVMGDLCKEATFQLEDGERPAFVLTFEDEAGASSGLIDQMTDLARRVADKARLGGEGEDASWLEGIQAPGSSGPQPWVMALFGGHPHSGLPSLGAAIEAIAASPMDSVVFCPLGRAIEDLGTMYDIDVLAADRALDSGLDFARAPLPNIVSMLGPYMVSLVMSSLGEGPAPTE